MTCSRTLDEFKQKVEDEICSIPAEMLQRAIRNFNG